VSSRENVNPKKDLRPPFFGSFFGRAKNEQKSFQDKESNIDKNHSKNGQILKMIFDKNQVVLHFK
jgi:hypothetical protein